MSPYLYLLNGKFLNYEKIDAFILYIWLFLYAFSLFLSAGYEVANVSLPGLLALLSILHVIKRDEELTIDHLIDIESLLWVPFQAHLDEVFKLGGPPVALDLRDIIVYDFPEKSVPAFSIVVGWFTRR